MTAADANRSNSGGAQAEAVRFDLDPDGLSVPHTSDPYPSCPQGEHR
jgi:hypothetical protein